MRVWYIFMGFISRVGFFLCWLKNNAVGVPGNYFSIRPELDSLSGFQESFSVSDKEETPRFDLTSVKNLLRVLFENDQIQIPIKVCYRTFSWSLDPPILQEANLLCGLWFYRED